MSEKPTVVEALSKVMEDVQSVHKDDRNTQQGFNFRGIDAVVNAVGPVLRKHGVIVVPIRAGYDQERYQTKSGTAMRGVTATIGYRFYGPAGDHIDAEVLGEASDSGDKAIPKAHSVAFRTLLLQALCVPTDEPDPDGASHERANGSAGASRERDAGNERSAESPAGDPHGLQASRGDAPTDKQKAMIRRLAKELTLEPGNVDSLTKSQASERIEELLAAKSHEKDAASVGGGASDLDDIPFMASEF